MKRYALQSLRIVISAVVFDVHARAEPLRVRAEPIRLQERIALACAAPARELRPRLERAIGSLTNGLEAEVTIAAHRAGYVVDVAVRYGTQPRGATRLEAPTCEEAVDAAVVVLSLALGGSARPDEVGPTAASPVPAASTAAPPALSHPARAQPMAPPPSLKALGLVHDAASADRRRHGREGRATRISLATGVDLGTLPHPTLTLGGAVERSFGGVGLVAIARYGLPSTEETQETSFSASLRRDFGSLELRACPGVGSVVRLAACVGAEASAVRVRRSWSSPDGTALDVEQLAPRFSGTLAALVAHRGGLIEPALELGFAAVAVGRAAAPSWLGVRVAAGAAIAF